MKLVIVESPAKAKSLGRYLGSGYIVLASYGHVRDLPSKQGSVQPDDDFSMTWGVIDKAKRPLKAIEDALKKSDTLFLATDPDREGEAISWHVLEVLNAKKLLQDKPVKRVVFNAVTKSAVLDAFKKPLDLNHELVEAYLARLSLDYLVGFTLSPVLWRKLPGSRSAGRVQSVALRLIVEREQHIETFQSQEYWTIKAMLAPQHKDSSFPSLVTHVRGEKLEKFTIANQEDATRVVDLVRQQNEFVVQSVEKKQVGRHPPPPFTTSTLQQEASRKLGMGASRTMRLAQQLYEGIEIDGESIGLITYMRTDSIQVTPEGINSARSQIETQFGKKYLPDSPRAYKSKAKNAQEAHEAIRPTSLGRLPRDLAPLLDKPLLQLYELIWKRMMASQMTSALFDQVVAKIAPPSQEVGLKSTGSTLAFDGFLKLYQEGRDEGDNADEVEEGRLPPLEQGQALSLKDVLPQQHWTQPKPRYTEASLVKKMEELGIGRPSTYARILQVLQDRQYVRMEKKQLAPEERGRIVTTFLKHFFARYVEYDFTADLESRLDDISAGNRPWKSVLREFWADFFKAIEASQNLKFAEVLETLEKDLEGYLFKDAQGNISHDCPKCETGRLGLRLGKFGAFVGCSNYPECNYTRPLHGIAPDGDPEGQKTETSPESWPKVLGEDPDKVCPVSVRLGPYGFYLQWGEGKDVKRVSLPKTVDPHSVTLEEALKWGNLPYTVGQHPDDQEDISVGLGRFGPYVKWGKVYASLKKADDVFNISHARALELLKERQTRTTKKK